MKNKYFALFSIFLLNSISNIGCKEKKHMESFQMYVLSPEKFDTVPSNQTVSIPLRISNNTSNKIILEKFATSCNCTVLDIKQGYELQKDEVLDTKINITVDSVDAGKIKSESITLKTNREPYFHNVSVTFFVKN